MILAVLDTNVLVSTLLCRYGPPRFIFDGWRQGKFELVTSLPCLEELEDVLGRDHIQRKYGLSKDDIDRHILLLGMRGTVVAVPQHPEPMCGDPKDDKFLVCALLGRASVVVSGDRHLLEVNGVAGIAVVRPRDFAETFLGGWQPTLPGMR